MDVRTEQAYQQRITALEIRVVDLETQLAQRDAVIVELRAQLAQRDTTIAALQRQVAG
jgi:uncharacterized coiled-coil protein SlyX